MWLNRLSITILFKGHLIDIVKLKFCSLVLKVNIYPRDISAHQCLQWFLDIFFVPSHYYFTFIIQLNPGYNYTLKVKWRQVQHKPSLKKTKDEFNVNFPMSTLLLGTFTWKIWWTAPRSEGGVGVWVGPHPELGHLDGGCHPFKCTQILVKLNVVSHLTEASQYGSICPTAPITPHTPSVY